MNGLHDMGGMHGMGPISYERNEPVFHQPWEGRVFALVLAMGAWRKWNIDASRYERELIPPAEYLRMSYYERWLAGLIRLIVKRGLATQAEIDTAQSASDSTMAEPALHEDKVADLLSRRIDTRRDVPVAPRFKLGQPIRGRNINPVTHTRLPRYVRGKLGTIERDHGVFVFPDTNSQFNGENPQHVYSVRFSARELWGDGASPRDSVYLDLWDDYLEPA